MKNSYKFTNVKNISKASVQAIIISYCTWKIEQRHWLDETTIVTCLDSHASDSFKCGKYFCHTLFIYIIVISIKVVFRCEHEISSEVKVGKNKKWKGLVKRESSIITVKRL